MKPQEPWGENTKKNSSKLPPSSPNTQQKKPFSPCFPYLRHLLFCHTAVVFILLLPSLPRWRDRFGRRSHRTRRGIPSTEMSSSQPLEVSERKTAKRFSNHHTMAGEEVLTSCKHVAPSPLADMNGVSVPKDPITFSDGDWDVQSPP